MLSLMESGGIAFWVAILGTPLLIRWLSSRQIGQHIRHDRLIHQPPLKRAARLRMIDRLGGRLPDHPRRGDRAFQPGQMPHLQNGRNPPAFLAQHHRMQIPEFHFR